MKKILALAALAALAITPGRTHAQDAAANEPISFSDQDIKQAPGYDAEEDARQSEEHKAAREAELEKMAAEQDAAHAKGPTDAAGRPVAAAVPWREGDDAKRARLEGLEGNDAPPLPQAEWLNSAPMDWDALRGKIVLVDFWATWCGPCLKSVPDTNALAEKYAGQGVVVVGVCNSRGVEKMRDTAIRSNIKYPICADVNDATVRAFRVDGFPDYYIVDHEGRIAMADVRAEAVELALQVAIAKRAKAQQSGAPGQ